VRADRLTVTERHAGVPFVTVVVVWNIVFLKGYRMAADGCAWHRRISAQVTLSAP
jgi:hypothetical protein